MQIDLVVFDVAGTTVVDDDAVGQALREAVIRRGARPSRASVASVMGLRKDDALRVLLAERPEGAPTDEEVATAHRAFEERMVHHYLTSPDLAPIAGAEAAFAELRASGVRVALATGFSRRILNAILLRLGWYEGDTVDVTVASDEVERGRPAPDLIRHAMRATGVADPACVAKVGDTVADVREGIAAGCGLVIGVTSGTATRLALRAERPSLVLPSVASVVAAVRAAERVGMPTRAPVGSTEPDAERIAAG